MIQDPVLLRQCNRFEMASFSDFTSTSHSDSEWSFLKTCQNVFVDAWQASDVASLPSYRFSTHIVHQFLLYVALEPQTGSVKNK